MASPGLSPPPQGLRRLLFNSAHRGKVSLSVPSGDELIVSEDVAAQLQAADTHFVDYDEKLAEAFPVDVEPRPSAPTSWEEPEEIVAAETLKAPKPRKAAPAKKAAAKKA